ncbi:hypothetical protein [Nocardia sp. XZ_19_231]|uniref:hypothetical protein n=1 Tax=Nocardia sp. XZ_19_231 TaxID=2769252 RepID=UPI00188EC1CE|nr:hypothetical protein [Nocardia sp. XZ_19_231]
MELKTKYTLYRFSVWCGIFVAIGAAVAFYGLGKVSPPSPTASAEVIQQHLVDNRTGILWCVVVMGLVAPFFYFFAVVTSLAMRRIEGGWGLLTMVQLTTAVVAPTGWIYPLAVLATAAYRPERSAEQMLQLSDQYWLTYVGVAFIFSINIAVIGVATLLDRNPLPTFPRWSGYANLVFAVAFAPGVFVYAFQDGPLAWNGFFAMVLPSIAFILWKIMMTYTLLRAVNIEEREALAGAAVPTLA